MSDSSKRSSPLALVLGHLVLAALSSGGCSISQEDGPAPPGSLRDAAAGHDAGVDAAAAPEDAGADAATDAALAAGPQVKCPEGTHRCGDVCASDRDIGACAGSCTPCRSPPHGHATCDGVRCGIVCDPGHHLCGDACLSDTSVASCGSSCSRCPTPARGYATCVAGVCGSTCDRQPMKPKPSHPRVDCGDVPPE